MALVQSQQIAGSGPGTIVPGPLLFLKQGTKEQKNRKARREESGPDPTGKETGDGGLASKK